MKRMQAEAPLITTIIPTYRRPHLLPRAIKSVLRQTYPRVQVCIYDNASGDETAAVVAELARDDPRVQYHCHAENIGMSANFTYAMEHITTPFFSILSDDDYLLPDFFATAMRGFTAHPDAIFSGGSVIGMTEAGQITHVPMDLWERDGYFSPPDGLFEWTIPKHPYITGLLFRTEVIEHVGLLDPTLLNSDYDFEWRIIARFPYVVSREPCVVITMHEQQATRTSDPGEWLYSYRVMQGHLRENITLSPDSRTRATALLRNTFADTITVVGLAALRDQNFAAAHQVAEVLRREFHMERKALLLDLLTTVCERIPPAHFCLDGAYRLLLRYRGWRTRGTRERIAASAPV